MILYPPKNEKTMSYMNFMKFDCSAMQLARLRRLESRFGLPGLGLYYKLMSHIIMSNGSLGLDEVMTWRCKGMRQDDIMVVLDPEAFGLFEVDCHGLVATCAGSRAGGAAGTSALDHAGGSAHADLLPTESEREKEREKLKEEMCGHSSDIWRERIRMQVTEYDLVMRHWTWCVEYFLSHLDSMDKNLLTLDSVRQYFVSFVRHPRLGRRFYQQLHRHDKEAAQADMLAAADEASAQAQEQFAQYMRLRCPHLVEMEDPLTLQEFRQLRQQFGKERVRQVLLDMENRPSLDCRSVYVTASKWLANSH